MISRTDIERLMSYSGEHMLSIYMPTVNYGTDTQQNSIRYKNLIDQAETILREKGMNVAETADFLKPLVELLNNVEYWKFKERGLAVFRSEEVFFTYPLPETVKEMVYVNTRFFIKPMINLLSNGDYFVLALSLSNIRLFSASRFSCEDITGETIPTNMEETLGYDNVEAQVHAKAQPGRGGERSAIFFGTGSSNETQKKDDIRRFFQILDKAVYNEISQSSNPLVLMGVEYLLPIYREVNSYPHLFDQTVTGNPEGFGAAEIQEATWPLVEPFFNQARSGAVDSYHIMANQQQASKDLRAMNFKTFFLMLLPLLTTSYLLAISTSMSMTPPIHLLFTFFPYFPLLVSLSTSLFLLII